MDTTNENPILTVTRHMIRQGADGHFALDPRCEPFVMRMLLWHAGQPAYSELVVGFFHLAAWLHSEGSAEAAAGILRAIGGVEMRNAAGKAAPEEEAVVVQLGAQRPPRRAPKHGESAPEGAIRVAAMAPGWRKRIY